jgi:hypothetical protein
MFSIRSMVLIVCLAILHTSVFAEADSHNAGCRGGTAAGMTMLVGPVNLVGLASEKRKQFLSPTWGPVEKREATELEVGKGLRILEVKTGNRVEYESAEAGTTMGE